MDTLDAPNPSSGLNRDMEPRVLGMEFGDGYAEIVPDGIHTLLMELEPAWNLLTFAEGDAMDAFFKAQHGRSFLWQMPRESAPRVWRCPSWKMTEEQTTSKITAKFKEQPA